MEWNDKGFLLSKNKYNENSVLAEIFTENYGKITGLIFGATSKKLKNYLEIGNNLHVNYNYKNETKIGYFKLEILKPYTPIYFDNKKKLLCIICALNLVKILSPERQSNSKIYNLLEKFYLIIDKKNWIQEYIFWELELFKLLGYDLELNSLVVKEKINEKTRYIAKSNNSQKLVPSFLVEKNTNNLKTDEILKGLNLVGDYLKKSILMPNNINYPTTRTNFINIIKS